MSAFLTFFDASDDRTADATFRLGDGEATRSMICNHGACFHIISTVITCNYLLTSSTAQGGGGSFRIGNL